MKRADAAFGPSWYAATAGGVRPRAPLPHNLDVDVCVIGGGLAGLTTARELARRRWSVALLEAKRLAWSASGRNAGLVAPGFAEDIESIIERVGLERAKALWALSAAGAQYVRDTIRLEAMANVKPVAGRLTVQRFDDDRRVDNRVALLCEHFEAKAEAWPMERVREALRTSTYYQAVHFPDAFHIHPLNYALELAAAAERVGARIFEDTPALDIDASGVRKHIATPGGRIRAQHVVLAGSAHLGAALFPAVANTVMPIATSVIVTAPIDPGLHEVIKFPGAVADPRRAGDYFRVVDGDRLLWGGGIGLAGAAPDRIRRRIGKVFPALRNIEISHAWSGSMGYAVHRMPLIGEVAPGVWIASAFGGHGVNTTAMAGQLIAAAIAEGDDRWRLFTPYGLVWTGGRAGRAAAQVALWSTQLRDAVGERVGRGRARNRHRKLEIARAAVETARKSIAEQARLLAEETRRAAEDAAREAAEAARLARIEADESPHTVAAEPLPAALPVEPQREPAVEPEKPTELVAAGDSPATAPAEPVGVPETAPAPKQVAKKGRKTPRRPRATKAASISPTTDAPAEAVAAGVGPDSVEPGRKSKSRTRKQGPPARLRAASKSGPGSASAASSADTPGEKTKRPRPSRKKPKPEA